MSLWDFLKRNKKDAFQQYADNMQPLQLVQVTPNAEGGVDAQVTEWKPKPTKAQQLKTRLADALLGDRMQATDNIGKGDGLPVTLTDEITGQEVTYAPQNVSTISENPRVGGLFNDIMNGAKENFATGFAAPNLFDDTTSDGRNKGFAYRLGEGLGTAGRFLESAPGRALLTAGAVGLAGGNGADMLAYGIQGGALNNRLRTQDRMYRDEMLRNAYNSLINSPEFAAMNDEQKQAALNNLQDQVNNMRGYVTDDMYKNFVTAQQLRDNADWKRLYFDSQQEQNRIMNGLRQDQLEYQKIKAAEDREFKERQLASDNYYKNANLGLGYARIAADERKANLGKPLSDSQVNTITQFDNALGDTQNIITKYKDSKYDSLFGVLGAIKRNPLTSSFDPLATELKQDIDLLRKTIAKAKEGGRLTDQDEKYYKKALFNPNLTRKKFLELAQEFYDNQNRQRNTTLNNYGLQGKNITNFVRPSFNSVRDTGYTKVGKYTVRVKQ